MPQPRQAEQEPPPPKQAGTVIRQFSTLKPGEYMKRQQQRKPDFTPSSPPIGAFGGDFSEWLKCIVKAAARYAKQNPNVVKGWKI